MSILLAFKYYYLKKDTNKNETLREYLFNKTLPFIEYICKIFNHVN
uniref:Uncharacterized protein n=1 Tax=Anguilla anguilla TaxID=7936 RepID=A0A0E9QK76_ANGAN